MAAAKVTGNLLLDKVIAQINKKYERELVTTESRVEMLEAIPTGSLSLDCAIGIGGLPKGRIIEIYGPESAAKSSLMLHWAHQAQKQQPEKYIVIVDAEMTMTEEFILSCGIDKNKLVFTSPDNVGEALDPLLDLVRTGQISYVGLDSVGALQSPTALKKGVTEADVGGISKIMQRFMGEFSKACVDTSTTAVFINQLRYNPMCGPYANPEVTPGGTALKFYSSLRIRAAQVKPSKTLNGAFTTDLRIIKNKCRAPVKRHINFDFVYAKGPDPILDTLNAGKDMGVLVFGGSTLKIRTSDTEWKPLVQGGVRGFVELCQEQPGILDEVRQLCLKYKDTQVVEDATEDTEDTG